MIDFVQKCSDVLLRQLGSVVTELATTCADAGGDLAVVETAVEKALRRTRGIMLDVGVQAAVDRNRRTRLCPDCRQTLHAWNSTARRVVTAEGEATYRPVRYRCKTCQRDYYPFEEANGLSGSEFTTGAKLLIAERAADDPYAETSHKLDNERALPVSPKEVDRTIREVAGWRQTEERSTKAAIYGLKAAEARARDEDPLAEAPKLHEFGDWRNGERALISVDGAFVRSPKMGPKGLEWFECRAGVIVPIEDEPHNTVKYKAYVAGVCDPDAIFDLLAATWRRGGFAESDCGFIADGARWIWGRVGTYFPKAKQILDIYHAGEHVGSAAAAWQGGNSDLAKEWTARARSMLLEPGGQRKILRKLLRALRCPDSVNDIDGLRREVRYLLEHRHRMNYAEYVAAGWPIGSGQMESSIKQLCTARLCGSGMKWSEDGADAVLCVRAAHLSGELRETGRRQHQTLLKAAKRYDPEAIAKAA
jgi:hypothetical protein